MKQVNCNSECMDELCTSWGAACGGFGVRIRYAINRSCPRRGIADMMTACEPCRWTFQVSLTLCRLYFEGVIETYTDPYTRTVSRTSSSACSISKAMGRMEMSRLNDDDCFTYSITYSYTFEPSRSTYSRASFLFPLFLPAPSNEDRLLHAGARFETSIAVTSRERHLFPQASARLTRVDHGELRPLAQQGSR